MAYRPQSRGCVKLVDVEGWFDDDDDGAGGGDDDNYDDDADVLLSSTKVCLPIPYTIRPKNSATQDDTSATRAHEPKCKNRRTLQTSHKQKRNRSATFKYRIHREKMLCRKTVQLP